MKDLPIFVRVTSLAHTLGQWYDSPISSWDIAMNVMVPEGYGLIRQAITITSKSARLCFKSPASRLFTQPFIQGQIKENIKAMRHWPLCGEFTGDR